MTTTMQALIFHAPGRISVEERPVPRIEPGEVLLRVRATSICASDIRVYKGEKKAAPGVVPGHEIAGEIAEVGEAVQGYRPGQRVVVCPIVACGACFFCLRGKRNRCARRVTLGYDLDGGLAQYVRVPAPIVQSGHLIPIADDLPLEIAAMTEPFACTLNSLETCQVQPGSSVVVIGAGPMGLTHLLLARAIGAVTVIVSDIVPDRLKMAEELGATACVHPQQQSLREVVLDLTGGLGADAVILSVGNVQGAIEGMGLVRKQGFFNLFAGFPPGAEFSLDANHIHYDELFLTGTQNATPDHYVRTAHLLRVVPQAERLLTHRFGPTDATKAYESRLGLDGLKSIVLY
ncbi:MAG: alcohol dehydrogenase catalytic domain-containing protein [Chloroflexi bacterium]|nr:alcohol dehydrogenase catalytic domain-containing protein [Chloroflexota bacterium]